MPVGFQTCPVFTLQGFERKVDCNGVYRVHGAKAVVNGRLVWKKEEGIGNLNRYLHRNSIGNWVVGDSGDAVDGGYGGVVSLGGHGSAHGPAELAGAGKGWQEYDGSKWVTAASSARLDAVTEAEAQQWVAEQRRRDEADANAGAEVSVFCDVMGVLRSRGVGASWR